MNNVTSLEHSQGKETVSYMKFTTHFKLLFGLVWGFFLMCSLGILMGVALTLNIKVTEDERQFLQHKIAIKKLLTSHHTLPCKEPLSGRIVCEYLKNACED